MLHQNFRTNGVAITWCQVLLVDECTGIQLKLGRDGFLTADFSLKGGENIIWFGKKNQQQQKRKNIFFSVSISFCLLRFCSPTSHQHFQLAISLILPLCHLHIKLLVSCFERILRAFIFWDCAYLERRCWILYFLVTQQATETLMEDDLQMCLRNRVIRVHLH